VLAVVTVAAVVGPNQRLEDPWRIRGLYGIELTDVHQLAQPVPMEGGQGWRVLARCRAPEGVLAGSPYMTVLRQEKAWACAL
jgi:hypothetical protein